MFKTFPKEVIENAVFEFVSTSKFPPTIADIKEVIYRQNTLTGYTFDEYWQMMMNGYRQAVVIVGGYSYWEAYQNFPQELQELVTYELYCDLAKMDDYRKLREKEHIKASLLSKREAKKREFLISQEPVSLLPHMQSLLHLNNQLYRKDNE